MEEIQKKQELFRERANKKRDLMRQKLLGQGISASEVEERMYKRSKIGYVDSFLRLREAKEVKKQAKVRAEEEAKEVDTSAEEGRKAKIRIKVAEDSAPVTPAELFNANLLKRALAEGDYVHPQDASEYEKSRWKGVRGLDGSL